MVFGRSPVRHPQLASPGQGTRSGPGLAEQRQQNAAVARDALDQALGHMKGITQAYQAPEVE
eukprot:8247238-Alexandrium_andersonii.AAC.1